LHSRAASSHLQHLDSLQTQIEHITFQSLLHHRNTAIMGLVCLLLLERDEGICRITAHCFVVLATLTIDLATFMPGILLLTCILLIPVTLKHWTDIGVAGKFQLSIFGTLFQLICS